MMNISQQHVRVVGCWHLGSVVGACLADVGHHVTLWDQRESIRASWAKGAPPIYEPGLNELAQKHWGHRLNWAAAIGGQATPPDWIVIAYDTPVDEQDRIELDIVEQGLEQTLNAGIGERTSFFLTSQLPVGTSRRFREQILKSNPDWKGHVLYMPENLRLGQGINSFKQPDRVVVGLDNLDDAAKPILTQQFLNLLGIPEVQVNVMSLESAEMVKHALNAFLGTCIVFANELSAVCERAGADAWDVVASLKQDQRVGPKAFLRPGLGFAGGTIARDVRILSELETSDEASPFFGAVYGRNAHRNDWILDCLKQGLGSVAGKRVVLLGVTYKPDTSTIRRSPAIEIAQLLKTAGATCVAVDPMADMNELTSEERAKLPFALEKDPKLAFTGAVAVVLVTEWNQFLELEWKKLASLMAAKPLLIDSKNHFAKLPLKELFTIRIPGRG